MSYFFNVCNASFIVLGVLSTVLLVLTKPYGFDIVVLDFIIHTQPNIIL